MARHLAILLVVTGCHGASGTAPDAAVVADSAPPDVAGIVTFDLHIFDTSQTTGLAGGSVCVVGQSDCETANASGDVTVSVAGNPADMKVAFAATAAGHLSTVELGRLYTQLDVFVHDVPSTVGLLPDADASALFTAAGLPYPSTSTGFVRATVLDGVHLGVQVGATVTLDGGGSAPVYLDVAGHPDPSLTAIGPGGGVLFGDVPAGPFALTVHVTGKDCIVQSAAWEGSAASSVAGVVAAGALTDGVTLACYDTE